MDFESALRYLDSLVSYERDRNFLYDERNFDLDNFSSIVKKIGVDYSGLRIVHVAGSKGKGTVCNLLSENLRRMGRSVGLFTSPHLKDIRERIRVNGEMISRDLFSEYVGEIADYLNFNNLSLTYFEILTLVALKFFVDEGVEFAVLEVGLGGRLDSTNIVFPELTVLTLVEMEHVGVLGENLEEILDEKLGILKEGVPLLIGEQTSEVRGLLERKLSNRSGVLYVSDENVILDCDDMARARNARIVLVALRLLFGDGFVPDIFMRIFRTFLLVGRLDMRKIGGKLVVFDVAHTVSGMKNLIEFLKRKVPNGKYVFLVSFLPDKNRDGMMSLIGRVAEIVYEGVVFGDVLKNLKRDRILVVTGSHKLVGECLP